MMLYRHSHFSGFCSVLIRSGCSELRTSGVAIRDRIWVSALALRGYSPDCSLGEKPLFSSILMKLRSCNKTQCPARSKHRWTTNNRLVVDNTSDSGSPCDWQREQPGALSKLRVLGSARPPSSWTQLCKSWLHLGLLQAAVLWILWLSLAKGVSGISPAVSRNLGGTWLLLLSLSLW